MSFLHSQKISYLHAILGWVSSLSCPKFSKYIVNVYLVNTPLLLILHLRPWQIACMDMWHTLNHKFYILLQMITF